MIVRVVIETLFSFIFFREFSKFFGGTIGTFGYR